MSASVWARGVLFLSQQLVKSLASCRNQRRARTSFSLVELTDHGVVKFGFDVGSNAAANTANVAILSLA